ncbi:MAG: DUF4907 domain-containing protein, partial [Bacteroidota bacterium]
TTSSRRDEPIRPRDRMVLLRLGILVVSVGAAALVVAVADGFESRRAPSAGWEVASIQSGTGWGYVLLADGRPLIRQPHLPAIEGEQPFATRDDALRVGGWVAMRLRAGHAPTVTIDDLVRLLPTYRISPADHGTRSLFPATTSEPAHVVSRD